MIDVCVLTLAIVHLFLQCEALKKVSAQWSTSFWDPDFVPTHVKEQIAKGLRAVDCH